MRHGTRNVHLWHHYNSRRRWMEVLCRRENSIDDMRHALLFPGAAACIFATK